MASETGKSVRLNKFLASCGLGSRRSCESLITEGRVEINGSITIDLSAKVAEGDHVKCDGKLLKQQSALTLVLNKPVGYLCTKNDPQGRKTIYELLPNRFASLNYIGRLDYNSSGLLLLTTSGELTEKLTHPRHHIEKEYAVHLDRPYDPNHSEKLIEGVPLMGGLARAESVTIESKRRLRLVLTQGYNRQIRRMLSKFGYKVKRLERVRIGQLKLPALSTGDYQILNHAEIDAAGTR